MEPSEQGREVRGAEADVLRSLFRAHPGSEEERIRRSGLPRTTYLSAKKRLYARGVVRDAYLPNPLLFGRRVALFVLARPYAEDFASVADRLREARASVVVWVGRTAIFGIQLHRTEEDAGHAREELSHSLANRLFTLAADLSSAPVPCYFDFEGIWSSIMEREGLDGYPRPLGGPLPQGWFAPTPSHAETGLAARLVRRSLSSGDTERASHLMGPHTLPRSERRLIHRGLVQWRVLPSIAAFPAHSVRRVQDLVFVHGALKDGITAKELLGRLVYEGHVFPFLYVTDGVSILLSGLGTGHPQGSSGTASVQGHRSVGGILEGGLSRIEVVRESLVSVTVTVDHRYDRISGED